MTATNPLLPAALRRERTPYGKTIRKRYEAGLVKEHRYNMTMWSPRPDGISNTITTVLKDNYILLEVNDETN